MQSTKWSIDPTHSEIHFKVKHLMISTVTGQFNKFNATVVTDGDDFSNAKVEFTAEIDSISTNNEQRDAHLKHGDFFDADNHPQLQFKSEKLEKTEGDHYKMTGLLTMRGVSKLINLNVEFGGTAVDPWGNTRAGFSISGKINRKDFGVSFGLTEAGGVVLGEEVKLHIESEFVKEAIVQAA